MITTLDNNAEIDQLWTLVTAGLHARAVQVVADLGLAECIDAEPVAVADLALACDASPVAIERILRLLSDLGVFRHTAAGYEHTAASRLLRGDHPTSLRAFSRLMGLPLIWGSVGALDTAIRTGSPGVASVAPKGLFDYLAEHPQEAEVFNAAMAAKAQADVAALLRAYDFGNFHTIVDIGGGRGHLITAILAQHRHCHGILFDLPHVIGQLDVKDEHLTSRPGDFFTDPLPHADLYLLMEVIHDWADREATAILRGIRAACTPGAVVLIIESIPADDTPDPRARTLDLIMLAVTGGQERTPHELEGLLTATGFRLTTVLDTAGSLRIAEAIAV